MPAVSKKREREIGRRLKDAREHLGVTQKDLDAWGYVRRTTLVNYETGITPLPWEAALRLCRVLVISEEWLATGRNTMVSKIAIQRGWPSAQGFLDKFFNRHCLDLFSEPITKKLPARQLFSKAFDEVLAARYAQLCETHFLTPRICLSEWDNLFIVRRALDAHMERWGHLIEWQAMVNAQDVWMMQRRFFVKLYEANEFFFRKFIGFASSPDELARLRWVRDLFENPSAQIIEPPLGVKKKHP